MTCQAEFSVFDRRRANAVLRGYRSLLPRQDKHMPERWISIVRWEKGRLGQVVDEKWKVMRLSTFHCDTLSLAADMSRRFGEKQQNSSEERFQLLPFLVWIKHNSVTKAWSASTRLQTDSTTAVNSRAAEAAGAVQQLCWKQTSCSKIRSNPLSIQASEKLKSHKPESCSQSASRFQSEPFIQFLRMNLFF